MSRAFGIIHKAGAFEITRTLSPHSLTVLAYHRITYHDLPTFDTFRPNVSATPEGFAAQLDYISTRYNVIAVDDLLAWLREERDLPPHPLLITFDDGYYDNYEHARPILQARGMPAVVFLATNHIGSSEPFYWDLVAYCFHHTPQMEAYLPNAGRRSWRSAREREAVMRGWIGSLKALPDRKKWTAVRALPEALGVSVPEGAFSGLHMSWDNVREMVAAGIDMGAHTQTHPILTRISREQASVEIAGSRKRIEDEIGQPVTTFAYPNGLTGDFNRELEAMLRTLGFEAAFTLQPGPARPREVLRRPMAIRRILINHRDTLSRFAAKLAGLPRAVQAFS
ncbi:MAG: hypothetical protein Kow00124_24520 [Anaerolineae bacterium]